jgi:hypothetical protein
MSTAGETSTNEVNRLPVPISIERAYGLIPLDASSHQQGSGIGPMISTTKGVKPGCATHFGKNNNHNLIYQSCPPKRLPTLKISHYVTQIPKEITVILDLCDVI